MASVTNLGGGRRMIQFIGSNRKRRTIYLGKVPSKIAEALKLRIRSLNAAKIANQQPDEETARWVAGLDRALYEKLSGVGLVPPRQHKNQTTLQNFLDAYVSSRADVKTSTATVYGHTKRNLIA